MNGLFDLFDNSESLLDKLSRNNFLKKKNKIHIEGEFNTYSALYNEIIHRLCSLENSLRLSSDYDSLRNNIDNDLDECISYLQDEAKSKIEDIITLLKESLVELFPRDCINTYQGLSYSHHFILSIPFVTNHKPLIGNITINAGKYCNLVPTLDRILNEYFGILYNSPAISFPLIFDSDAKKGLLLIYDNSDIDYVSAFLDSFLLSLISNFKPGEACILLFDPLNHLFNSSYFMHTTGLKFCCKITNSNFELKSFIIDYLVNPDYSSKN